MASSYNPGTHTSPYTATVGSASVTGLAPGQVYTELNDSRAPTYVFLSTGTTSDGYPSAMLPFATGTGAVT